jgi:UMF1 family MFS transporter
MNKRMKKGALSWALYDWANSAFSTTVIAGFFPVFFKDYWSAGVEATVSTFWLGVSITSAGLIVAIFAPILGSFADRGSAKKRMLFFFSEIGILFTAALAIVPGGYWPGAAVFYVISYACWLFSLIFYDSLIVTVSDAEDVDRISGIGFSLGYLGGGLLFALNVMMTLKPDWFGLSGPVAAVKLSFISVSIWWTLFMIPLLSNVPESRGERIGFVDAAKQGFRQLFDTFAEIRKFRYVALFLFAYWLYIDGVDTIIAMAVDYGKSIGIQTNELITALMVVQFVAFPFAYLFGAMGQRFGARRFIFLGIIVYTIVTYFGANMDTVPIQIFGITMSKFLFLAMMIGTVQGGIQALSRSFYTRIIPDDRSAEFFGFYNMVGKFAAIIGPVLMGTVGRVTGNPRFGILSIAILFLFGAGFLLMVDETKARRMVGK